MIIPVTPALEARVLLIVRDFLSQSGKERVLQSMTLNSSIERDLGIDSLSKVELFHRIEKAFAIQLPDKLLAEAETLNDVILGLQQANPPQHNLPSNFSPQLKKSTIDPSNCQTLVELLSAYDDADPLRPHIYFQDEYNQEQVITYGELFTQAQLIATGLQQKGIQPNESVAIMLPSCADFFYVFFGILLTGAVPVPIYPPFRLNQIEEYAEREAKVLRNAQARILITFQQTQRLSKLLKPFILSLKAVVTAAELRPTRAEYNPVDIQTDATALIQYTSGSTGVPKGVVLSHKNLLANIRAYGEALAIKPSDVTVSWLPLYHDMGLIGAWLGSLYYGLPLTILSPLTFLNRPERWLWAIHYHRATISAAPNFAYELCNNKIDEYALEGLDLSSWRAALNGAEGINPRTLERFTKKFARYGFKPEALIPVYGLAENSVALTVPPLGKTLWVDRINHEAFATQRHAIPAEIHDKKILEFVSCGKALPHHAIKIVNESGETVGERMVGELYFTGPSAMSGYFHNPAATQAIFHQGWWSTGDLAYIAEDEIFITGRKKDLIIKAGRNIYPEEIEAVVNQIPGIRKGCVVAFGIQDSHSGTEKLLVAAEIHKDINKNTDELSADVIKKVSTITGIPPDEVILLKPHTIPKTSSGKLRRSATKDAYLQGLLTVKPTPAWMQISKFWLASRRKKLMRGFYMAGRLLYSIYMTMIVLITVLPTWLLVLILPQRIGKQCLRYCARILLLLAGCGIKINKITENQTLSNPIIYVANHASYVDVVALISQLPKNVLFVGKQELLKMPIIGTFIKRLGYLTVERFDFSKSIEDAEKLKEALQQGNSLLIFPEGTFTYSSGLRPFKLGAFKIAVDTQTSVWPIALKGTRTILRAGKLLPRPGIIHITFCQVLTPRNAEWQEVIHLATTSRIEIAKYCGEYPIDLITSGAKKEN